MTTNNNIYSNNFIDKIAVHERVKGPDGKKTQEIEIYYSYVGIVNVPTAEELEVLRKEVRKKPAWSTGKTAGEFLPLPDTYIFDLIDNNLLLVIQTKEKSEIKEKLNSADRIFQSNFSLLCNNLNEQETAETNEENIKYEYVWFSILKLTSFSESEAMNKVVHSLYDLSEKKELYSEIKETEKKDLNKLCQNLHYGKLLNKIIEEIY